MDDEKRQQDDWANKPSKNRLPSFTEVLSRKTRPPTFWLDVQQHENLCRAYFKDVRKSGKTIKEDWPQYWDYARRRGSIYGTVVGLNPDMNTKRSTRSTTDLVSDLDKRNLAATDGGGRLWRRSITPPTSPRARPPSSPRFSSDNPHGPHRFRRTHLLSVPLPAGNTSQAELSIMAQIPDMFHAQKEYCFRAMEQDAFPRFLRSKAFGNLTPISGVGLAVGFSLIFLDVEPNSAFPYTLAILFLISHQYELDPILVFLNSQRRHRFRTLTMREPYRSGCRSFVAAFSTALTMLFWAVPGPQA
ncbi:hypothetical protein BKA70DRAFT_1378884 [Coprinopsis sp. MPI-PUGE-AT-0042]|nr:hypothetical protein BKA70DRAFT_1378884 [Coprinopsis sp. MPI-PUGE-AT-0042]